MAVLVTGAGGYVGQHVIEEMNAAGIKPIALDSRSEISAYVLRNAEGYRGNYGDPRLIDAICQQHEIDAVVHLGGSIQVGESVRDPYVYYANNVSNTVGLLGSMRRNNINKIVFSSTAAVYGNSDLDPIPETAPINPINPYGHSKAMVEKMLKDHGDAYGLKWVALRFFNVAGASKSGEIGENHPKPDTHLIPSIFEAIKGEREQFTVFGQDYPTVDGTCIRDYVHVTDLARAIVKSLNYLDDNPSDVFNIGSGVGYSVKQILLMIAEAVEPVTNISYGERREGDPAKLLADISKAREILGWEPEMSDLYTIINTAWRYYNEE